MTTIYVTNKDNLPARRLADVYSTERTLVRAALARFAPPRADSILDIGAGDGRWGQLALAHYAGKCKPLVHGVELRLLPRPTGFYWWYRGSSFLLWKAPRPFDLIISNPPYYLAEAIIRRAWGILESGGVMIMLLRLAFQAGIGRAADLWQKCPLLTVGICSRRPSFYGGGTNGTDYGIFHWVKGQGTPGQWQAILIDHQRES